MKKFTGQAKRFLSAPVGYTLQDGNGKITLMYTFTHEHEVDVLNYIGDNENIKLVSAKAAKTAAGSAAVEDVATLSSTSTATSPAGDGTPVDGSALESKGISASIEIASPADAGVASGPRVPVKKAAGFSSVFIRSKPSATSTKAVPGQVIIEINTDAENLQEFYNKTRAVHTALEALNAEISGAALANLAHAAQLEMDSSIPKTAKNARKLQNAKQGGKYALIAISLLAILAAVGATVFGIGFSFATVPVATGIAIGSAIVLCLLAFAFHKAYPLRERYKAYMGYDYDAEEYTAKAMNVSIQLSMIVFPISLAVMDFYRYMTKESYGDSKGSFFMPKNKGGKIAYKIVIAVIIGSFTFGMANLLTVPFRIKYKHIGKQLIFSMAVLKKQPGRIFTTITGTAALFGGGLLLSQAFTAAGVLTLGMPVTVSLLVGCALLGIAYIAFKNLYNSGGKNRVPYGKLLASVKVPVEESGKKMLLPTDGFAQYCEHIGNVMKEYADAKEQTSSQSSPFARFMSKLGDSKRSDHLYDKDDGSTRRPVVRTGSSRTAVCSVKSRSLSATNLLDDADAAARAAYFEAKLDVVDDDTREIPLRDVDPEVEVVVDPIGPDVTMLISHEEDSREKRPSFDTDLVRHGAIVSSDLAGAHSLTTSAAEADALRAADEAKSKIAADKHHDAATGSLDGDSTDGSATVINATSL